jgi:dephospho-CoA kinase
MRIGLTGGLACGKSFVGKTLQQLGAYLIHADELGHRTLEPDGEAYQTVIDEFGPEILDSYRRIDRRKLAALVFGHPERLAKLNSIVHPAVYRLQQTMERDILARDPRAIVVFEAAILIETGTYKNYDRIVLVTCTEKQQIERAMSRGISREEAEDRLNRQLPLEAKRQFADYIIDASGAKDETIRQTQAVYNDLLSHSAGRHAHH